MSPQKNSENIIEAVCVATLDEPLEYNSFQATFYDLQFPPGYIAKVYTKEKMWDLIPFNDLEARHQIMVRELECLRILASTLDPQIRQVQLPGGLLEQAIIMKKVESSQFMDAKLLATESIGVVQIDHLVDKIIAYHFNPEVCPQAKVETMCKYMVHLIDIETKILVDHFPDESEKYLHWHKAITSWIAKNSQHFELRQQTLHEPIIGHGDIKTTNIFWDSANSAGIIDTCPVADWRVQDRIMDAFFVAVDLELSGFQKIADQFREKYLLKYKNNIRKKLEQTDLLSTEQSIELMCVFSRIYHLIIFLRLAKISGNIQRAELAEKLLMKDMEKII